MNRRIMNTAMVTIANFNWMMLDDSSTNDRILVAACTLCLKTVLAFQVERERNSHHVTFPMKR